MRNEIYALTGLQSIGLAWIIWIPSVTDIYTRASERYSTIPRPQQCQHLNTKAYIATKVHKGCTMNGRIFMKQRVAIDAVFYRVLSQLARLTVTNPFVTYTICHYEYWSPSPWMKEKPLDAVSYSSHANNLPTLGPPPRCVIAYPSL